MSNRFRAALILLIIAFVVYMTLLPGNSPIYKTILDIIGHSEIVETLCHMVVFSLLTVLCFAGALMRLSVQQALITAACAVLILSVGTEILQHFFSGRSSSWLDLAADCVGIVTFVLWVRWWENRHALKLA